AGKTRRGRPRNKKEDDASPADEAEMKKHEVKGVTSEDLDDLQDILKPTGETGTATVETPEDKAAADDFSKIVEGHFPPEAQRAEADDAEVGDAEVADDTQPEAAPVDPEAEAQPDAPSG